MRESFNSIQGPSYSRDEGKSVPFEPASWRIPGRHGARFIDSQNSALKFFAVHLGNSLIPALLHLHKTETFGPPCVSIADDTNRFNGTCLAEQFLQISFGCFKRQISYIQLLFHRNTSSS